MRTFMEQYGNTLVIYTLGLVVIAVLATLINKL